MIKRSWLLVVLLSSMRAQTSLSARDAVSQALAAHPLLAEGAERAAAADALRVQAGLRPNPRLFLQTENLRAHGTPGFNFGNDADVFAYASQVFETGGKRARRVESAGAAARRATLERELLARQISTRVTAAYWDAAISGRLLDLLRETEGAFRQIVEYHEARVREGAMAEADLLRVRLEGQRLELAVNSAALDAERARIRLFREMGQTQFPQVAFTDRPEPDPTAETPAPDVARALENRAEMKLARNAVEQARASVALQRSLVTPNVDALFGYKRTAGFNTVLAGVQIDLPFSNRNQGAISAAEREAKAAEAALAAAEAVIRAEVAAAARDFEIRRRQAVQLLPALRDRAAESAKIALAAYREGGGDLLRLLDAERLRIDAQVLYYRTLADYQQSKAALAAALGVEP